MVQKYLINGDGSPDSYCNKIQFIVLDQKSFYQIINPDSVKIVTRKEPVCIETGSGSQELSFRINVRPMKVMWFKIPGMS